ncbi:ABC transporter [Streptomyces sp. NPDC094437]|uniref:ABC transporter n=1 Tax=Streptomyces sp. NPDC094437 TaxID=3366060 RepID=UPI0037FC75A0
MRRVNPPPVTSLLALTPFTLRVLPWRLLAVTAGPGPLLAAVPRVTDTAPSPWQTVNLLRAAALLYALGLAFVLDDPARHTTATVPTGRALRTWLRLALVAPLTVVWWAATLLAVPGEFRPPVGDVTLEAGAACAVALAGAAVAVRLSQASRPGRQVASAVLLTALLTPLFLPDDWPLFPAPGAPEWPPAHTHWTYILTTTTLILTRYTAERPPHRRAT